jgi:elongation factor P--beta-lysine ligase
VANGYDELQDVQDYQKCFEYEINKRLVLGKTPVAIDKLNNNKKKNRIIMLILTDLIVIALTQ